MNNSKLLIIDLSNFIHRAFYGIKPLFNKEGFQTNAIYGVANMYFNLIKHTHPSHVIVALDSKGRKERNELYDEYKGNRKKKPDELTKQIQPILEMINLMNLCSIEYFGQEADDVIGTLVKREKDNFQSIFIASSDKDLMQLVDDNVYMYDSMKNLLYNQERVIEKFGVKPKQIIDYLALIGDKSDNVPGIPGVGGKTASKLLEEYNTLENIYDNLDKIKSQKMREKFENNKELGFLSKELVTINCDLDLEYSLDSCDCEINLSEELESFLDKYSLNSIRNRIIYNG